MAGHSLPEPIAQGDLARTPFAHLLLYIEKHQLSGTLVVWHPAPDGEKAKQDRIRFEGGEPVAGRLIDRTSRLDMGMLPIFARSEGPYAFYGDTDLVGEGPEVRVGQIDPYPLIAASLRGSARDDAVDAVLGRFGETPVRLVGEIDLDRFRLLPAEATFFELVRAQPSTCAHLAAIAALPPRMAERLLYLLAITKTLEPYKASPTPVATAPVPSMPVPSVPAPSMPVPSMPPPVSSKPPEPAPAVSAPPPPSKPRIASDRPPPPPDTLSPEHRALWDEVTARANAIDKENYFTMLGVLRDAPGTAIQKAYFGLVKKWHPDRLPAELAELRPFAENIFRHLTRAHDVLSDESKRGPYIATVQDGGGTPEADRKMGQIVQAALDFRKIEIMIKQRQLEPALAAIEQVLAITDEEADYHAAHGWVRFQLRPSDPSELRAAITAEQRALELNPKHDRAHFYIGIMLRKQGKEDKAIEHLQSAARLNPKNIDAAREVRLAQMRKSPAPSATTSQSSLLSKIFGGDKKKS